MTGLNEGEAIRDRKTGMQLFYQHNRLFFGLILLMVSLLAGKSRVIPALLELAGTLNGLKETTIVFGDVIVFITIKQSEY